MIGRELLKTGNAIHDKGAVRWSSTEPLPCGESVYAGGERRHFTLDQVTRWGRLTSYGDAIAHFVAEVDGHHYKLLGGERTPEEQRFLGRLGKRLPGRVCGRLEWWLIWEPVCLCGHPQSAHACPTGHGVCATCYAKSDHSLRPSCSRFRGARHLETAADLAEGRTPGE